MVAAVAEDVTFQSERPLFGNISHSHWYGQFYWPFALDQSKTGLTEGYYDVLLIDRNHDGDMTDKGERVQGELSSDKGHLQFQVGDLFIRENGKDRTFQIVDMVMVAKANSDPSLRFSATFHSRMFANNQYQLAGPYNKEMKLSDKLEDMPTLNLTPEISHWQEKQIRLFLVEQPQRLQIGDEQQPVRLVLLTGDPAKNDYVFAIKNQAFKKPLVATLVYEDMEGKTRGKEFSLTDWEGDFQFAGTIEVPADAKPGKAALVTGFSEVINEDSYSFKKHFTQIAGREVKYTDSEGKAQTTEGWRLDIELIR